MKNTNNKQELEVRGTDSYEAVVSSEYPVDRDGIAEVLIHTEESIDRSRFPVPLLVNHNLNNQIGVVENPRIESDKLVADIRFTNDELGKQYEQDVIDKVRNNLSIGYKIIKKRIKDKVMEVTNFLIYEVSVTPVNADPTSTFREENLKLVHDFYTRNNNMEEKQSRSEIKASLKTESQIREELSEIITLGAKHNQSELASRHIENGSSIDEFRADLMSHIESKPLNLGTAPAFIQTRNEDYSVAKAILGMDDVSQRGFEWEVSQDLERQQPKSNPNAVIIDMTRTMTSGTAGANTIETNVASSIQDFMQQKQILGNLGASNFTGNVGNLDIPIGNSDSGVTALQTDGSTQAGEVTPTLTKLSLVAKRFGTVIPLSYGFLQQSTPDVEGYVRRLIAETFAKNMDDQIIGGSGSSGNVTGLLNTTGINAVSNSGSEVTFANFMSAISELGTDAVDVSNLKLIVNPANLDNLVTAVKYTSTDSPILDMKADTKGLVGTFMGYPVYATSKISPDNYLMGDFSHLAIASWGGLELAKDDFYDTRRFNCAITGIHTFDAGALNPTAFCKITKA